MTAPRSSRVMARRQRRAAGAGVELPVLAVTLLL